MLELLSCWLPCAAGWNHRAGAKHGGSRGCSEAGRWATCESGPSGRCSCSSDAGEAGGSVSRANAGDAGSRARVMGGVGMGAVQMQMMWGREWGKHRQCGHGSGVNARSCREGKWDKCGQCEEWGDAGMGAE